jgi:hypothetical protein
MSPLGTTVQCRVGWFSALERFQGRFKDPLTASSDGRRSAARAIRR